MASRPFVSLIICTRDRAASVARAIESVVAAAQHVGEPWELLVVDNGSTDATQSTIESFAARLPVKRVWEPIAGLASARNTGVAASSGRLLIFTDDDCRLEEDYLKAAKELDEGDGSRLVFRGGRVRLGSPCDLPLSIKDEADPAEWHRDTAVAHRTNLADAVIGCNMMMRRELYDRLGPFDERLGAGTEIPGGEDSDYVIRAYRAGSAVVYSPEICVMHHHGRRTRAAAHRLLKNYAIGTGALFAKYALVDLAVVKQPIWDLRNWVWGRSRPVTDNLHIPLSTKVRHELIGAWRFIRARSPETAPLDRLLTNTPVARRNSR